MLSPRDIERFTEVCTAIGDEVADERGFVSIRDLLRRFNADVIVRPLLVEGMLASINELHGSGASRQRWAVVIDSETYSISDADIANESSRRPLSARLRNTIAHELAHSLAFRPSEFGITLNQTNGGESKSDFVRSIEQITEGLSPLLLFTDKALTRFIRGRKTQVSVEELDKLRQTLGISRDLLVARLCRLRSSQDGRFRESTALRGLGIGIGEWTVDGSAALRSWPLYINFDRNIAPAVFRMLPSQNRLPARTAFPESDWLLAGGTEHKATFWCEAGLSSGPSSERLLVEGGVSRAAQKTGSAFLYVIRTRSDSDVRG
jgi:hypothetical protein